jgi:hypothetical protein
MSNTNITLFGGRLATVKFNDDRTEEITVRQLKLRDYEAAFKKINDEIDLTAFICGKTKEWLAGKQEDGSDGIVAFSFEGATGIGYEELQALCREVNKLGFFVWAKRRADRDQAQMAEQLSIMAQMPPEMVRLTTEAGLTALKVPSASPTSSQTSAPRPR